MPRYANPVSVEDLALTMPIGKQITVVIAESTNEIKSLEHDSHKVVMLAPKGVKCRLDLISEAADIYSSRDRRGGFSSSDPPPLIDIRDVIEFPKTTLSLVNSERKEVPPRRNPIIWPEGGKVTLEEGLALVTTVYKKVCQIWIPNHGLEIAHVDGLINVRQEFMPLVVKPLQLVKFTSEVCDMKNSSGISRSVVALEPFNDGEFHHWNKLFVGPAWVSSAMETKKANGTKPGFSAVLLK